MDDRGRTPSALDVFRTVLLTEMLSALHTANFDVCTVISYFLSCSVFKYFGSWDLDYIALQTRCPVVSEICLKRRYRASY